MSRRKEERLGNPGLENTPANSQNAVNDIHTGPHADPTLAGNQRGAGRRGSRQQRQDAAVGVDVGSLRSQAINQFRGIEPLTINPNEVENTGAEGERRVEVKKRGVGDALKNFQ